MLNEEYFMTQAMKLAERAFDEAEVPIGALVVLNKQIIGKGYNQVEKLKDPTAHAEMLAITAASHFLGSKYLNECEIYITVEPCVMCYGAILHARISKAYFALHEPKTGFTQHLAAPKLDYTLGLQQEKSQALMQDFFQKRRKG